MERSNCVPRAEPYLPVRQSNLAALSRGTGSILPLPVAHATAFATPSLHFQPASDDVTYRHLIQAPAENPRMYTEVFRNSDVYGSSFRPLLRLGCWTVSGSVIVLVILVIAAGAAMHQLGLADFSTPSYMQPRRPTPVWVQIGLCGLFFVIGLWTIAEGFKQYRAALAARRLANDPNGLKSVEGTPRYSHSTNGGLLRLHVGGMTFSLVDATGRRGHTDDYSFGESTEYRGLLRAWYAPGSELLLRCEWRPFTAEEVRERTDKIIAENKVWAPNLPSILDKSADDPKVMADAQNVVDRFLKDIRADVAKLEELQPKLLPGNPQKERNRVEEEFELIVTRIEFTRNAVISALKTVKKLGF